MAQIESGDLDAGIADLSEVLRKEPGNPDAYHQRGWGHFYKRDHDRALADFRKVAALTGDDAKSQNGLCWALAARGEHAAAIAHCDKAAALLPDDAAIYQGRALAKLGMGAAALALSDFDHALTLKPEDGSLYADRARAHEARGDRARAVADYQKAATLPSRNFYDAAARAEALRRLTAFAMATPDAARPDARAPTPTAMAQPSAPERRVALVIGNSAYRNVPALLNPRNDARAVAASLRRLGFDEVIEQYDLTRPAMTAALQQFGELSENADWAVVYYAGHGIEVGGVNYAIPIEAALKVSTHVDDEGVSIERVVATVGTAKKMRLVILDACRDNPFVPKMRNVGGTRSVGRGLSRIEPPPGVLVAFAARDGLVALDGEAGNSPFASALVEFLEEPGVEINFLFRKVRDKVFTSTRGQQEPFTYGSLPAQQFFFRTARP